MDKIIVEGGRRLPETLSSAAPKMPRLPILVSSLLTDGKNTYTNVPNLKDIESTCVLLRNHGARVDTAENLVTIDAGNLSNTRSPLRSGAENAGLDSGAGPPGRTAEKGPGVPSRRMRHRCPAHQSAPARLLPALAPRSS